MYTLGGPVDALLARHACGCVSIICREDPDPAILAKFYSEAAKRKCTIERIKPGDDYTLECPDLECKWHRKNKRKLPNRKSLWGF